MRHVDCLLPAHSWRVVVGSVLLVALGACVTFPYEERVLATDRGGQIIVRALPCGAAVLPTAKAQALDGGVLRILVWNLHKNDDPGWQTDLARFAAESDLLLIQEAALTVELRHVVETSGHRWLLASALRWNGREMGVMTAARVEPVGACAKRSQEPLLQVPKTAIIAYYSLAGRSDTLAVANIHAINFTLDLASYRQQLEAVAAELIRHEGPMIFAGDLNTWTAERAIDRQRDRSSPGIGPGRPRGRRPDSILRPAGRSLLRARPRGHRRLHARRALVGSQPGTGHTADPRAALSPLLRPGDRGRVRFAVPGARRGARPSTARRSAATARHRRRWRRGRAWRAIRAPSPRARGRRSCSQRRPHAAARASA